MWMRLARTCKLGAPKAPAAFDKEMYKARSEVECTLNLLKQARRFATRYESLGAPFCGWVSELTTARTACEVTLTPTPLPEGEGLKQATQRDVRPIGVMPRLLRPDTYRARQLRARSTPAEITLWQLLRGRRVDGAKFRRQQPVGPFFADFVCLEARLVVEADGAPHFPKPMRDILRDAWLRQVGFRVLRFPNHEILHHADRVLQRIRAALQCAPLPPGEGLG